MDDEQKVMLLTTNQLKAVCARRSDYLQSQKKAVVIQQTTIECTRKTKLRGVLDIFQGQLIAKDKGPYEFIIQSNNLGDMYQLCVVRQYYIVALDVQLIIRVETGRVIPTL